MGPGIESLHKVLKDETRRKIILLLQEKGSLSYVDLMKALEITNTGKMNYHLKVLGNLLSKKEDGQYALSEKGVLASRLLLEFPAGSTKHLGSSSKSPQVFWWGIIICGFALIGWTILLRVLSGGLTSDDASNVEFATPFIFLCAVFSFTGAYMIVSDLQKEAKASRQLSRLTKRAVVVSAISLVILGTVLLGVAATLPVSEEHLTKIAEEENPGANYTFVARAVGTPVYRFDITVANTTRLDQSVNITVTNLEENHTWNVVGGTIRGQTLEQYFPPDAGRNVIDWHGLNVTQITLYERTGVTSNISRLISWAAGVFAVFAGALSLFGFELGELFQGMKTGIFWWGLIVFDLALSLLFGLLWHGVFFGAGIYDLLSRLASLYGIPGILAGLVFSFIGFRMMKQGAKKEGQFYGSPIESTTSKLAFYLSQRNYRALAYLLASIIVNIWAFEAQGYISSLVYVNYIGFLLLLVFFGRPSMYGGWFDPTSVLPFILLVFGLFVEIFIAGEFLIALEKLLERLESKIKKSQTSDPIS